MTSMAAAVYFTYRTVQKEPHELEQIIFYQWIFPTLCRM